MDLSQQDRKRGPSTVQCVGGVAVLALVVVGAVAYRYTRPVEQKEVNEDTSSTSDLRQFALQEGGNSSGTFTVQAVTDQKSVVHQLAFSKFQVVGDCTQLAVHLFPDEHTIELSKSERGDFIKKPLPGSNYSEAKVICDQREIGTTTKPIEVPDLPPVLKQGSFKDADSFHKTSGEMKLMQSATIVDGKVKISYELVFVNLDVTAGPDVLLYLSPTDNAQNNVNALLVSLDDTQGGLFVKTGNFKQSLPDDFDPAMYKSAVVWCRAYSVLFGTLQFEAVQDAEMLALV